MTSIPWYLLSDREISAFTNTVLVRFSKGAWYDAELELALVNWGKKQQFFAVFSQKDWWIGSVWDQSGVTCLLSFLRFFTSISNFIFMPLIT